MITNKKNKQIQEKKNNKEEKIRVGLTKLENESLKLDPEVLKTAAKKLKKKFKGLAKSLLQRGAPSPYIRSLHSRPLHFTQDGRFLMYFSKTEFVKISLPKLKICERRKFPIADLSSLFYDYKFWSHDSSKVLALNSRVIESSGPRSGDQGFIYDVNKGEYTEIFEGIRKSFDLTQKNKGRCMIECFHPTNKTQLILRHRVGEDEDLYSWNWRTHHKRNFARNKRPGSYLHVITQSNYIVVMALGRLRRPLRRVLFLQPFEEEMKGFVDVYKAKNFKKLATLHAIDSYNSSVKSSEFSKILTSFCPTQNPCLTHFGSLKIGHFCLKYSKNNFLVLDFLKRDLISDFMDPKESSLVEAYLPASLSHKRLLEDDKKEYGYWDSSHGYTLISGNWDRKQNVYDLFGNRIKIFSQSNLVVKILIRKQKNSKIVLDLELYNKRFVERCVKKSKKLKLKKYQNLVKSGGLMKKLTFNIPDFCVDVNQFSNSRRSSQVFKKRLHSQELILQKEKTNLEKNGFPFEPIQKTFFVLSHKEISLKSWTLKRLKIMGGGYLSHSSSDKIKFTRKRELQKYHETIMVSHCSLLVNRYKFQHIVSCISDISKREFHLLHDQVVKRTGGTLFCTDTGHRFRRVWKLSSELYC